MELLIRPFVREKIEEKHGVTELEVEEAFFLHEGSLLIDDRVEHRTRPPTVWFISGTSEGRLLKLVLIWDIEQRRAVLKTAYEPTDEEIELYEANHRGT